MKDHGWTLDDQNDIFDPSYISDASATAAKQRTHPMQLRSAKVQEVSLNNINIGDLLQSNSMIQWLSQQNTYIISVYSHSVHKLCIIGSTPLFSTYINTHVTFSFSFIQPVVGTLVKFPKRHLFLIKDILVNWKVSGHNGNFHFCPVIIQIYPNNICIHLVGY